MIGVLDYGIGNLRSAEKALLRVGAPARLVETVEDAAGADGLVLPGVSAFGSCARALRSTGLDEAVLRCVAEGRPLLGICVGLQLLFEGSEEDPGVEGLSILPGVVRRLPPGERRPQMQWNVVRGVEGRPSVLLGDPRGAPGAPGSWYYFVHSYAPVPEEDEAHATCVGTCEYGGTVAVVFERANVLGTQFHPEKSAAPGLALLRRFADLCEPERRGAE